MNTITKTAQNREAHRAPTFFYPSAREGVADMLRHLTGTSQGVLLPGYIGWSAREGSGVLDPVTGSGRPMGFYDLGDDLSVNLDSLRSHLEEGDYGVVFVLHYFGRTDPRVGEIGELVRGHGAVLVEDLAHGFFSSLPELSGTTGDVSVFSLHKMFPMPDGGMIRYRDSRLVTGQRSTAPQHAETILQYDWETVASRRRSNMERLVTALRALPCYGRDVVLLWDSLAPQDVPQTVPVRILEGNRDALYEKMNGHGVGMVSLYHTLTSEVRGLHPHLDQLSREIINFPVHQDLHPDDMAHIARVFDADLRGF